MLWKLSAAVLMSHLCAAMHCDTLSITCPARTPLCIITGANTPIQHDHGVSQHNDADYTEHCSQEQLHWWWWDEWNLNTAHHWALLSFTTICQYQIMMLQNHFKLYETRVKNLHVFQRRKDDFQITDWKGCGRNQMWSNLTYNPDIFLRVWQKVWRTPVRIVTLKDKCELWISWVCIKQKCWPQGHIAIMHLSDLSLLR